MEEEKIGTTHTLMHNAMLFPNKRGVAFVYIDSLFQ